MKHTPGPWTVNGLTITAPTLSLDFDCTEVCEVYDDDNPLFSGYAEVDARLIAAAPELYKTLKDILSTVEAGDNDDDFIRAAQAAIKKAEGVE